MKENTLHPTADSAFRFHGAGVTLREDLSEYVAHLQLHMALQSRNLVPHLSSDRLASDSRSQLLHKTQADFEKFASRQ